MTLAYNTNVKIKIDFLANKILDECGERNIAKAVE